MTPATVPVFFGLPMTESLELATIVMLTGSHPELRQVIPSRKNSNHTDKNEDETKRGRLPVAIANETKNRIREKNQPSNQSQQKQHEKAIGITICHKTIEQRTSDEGAAYEAAPECETADCQAHVFNMRGDFT